MFDRLGMLIHRRRWAVLAASGLFLPARPLPPITQP